MKIAFVLGLAFLIVGIACYVIAYFIERAYKKKMQDFSKNK